MTAPGARVLVTGGTGRLGRVLTPLLAAAGYDVAVVSRRTPQAAGTQPDQAVPPQGTLRVRQVRADLVSGDGLGAALDGVEVVVHLATANGRRDVAMMRHLVTSSARIQAAGATPPHLIYLSIVGCDAVPLPYYRHKVHAEGLALGSPAPVTVLRSTQFHALVAELFASQRRLPALMVPSIPMQPIDTRDVAARLLELVARPVGGRVDDIGGPETAPLAVFAGQWQRAHGGPGRKLPLRLPGRTFAAYRAGRHVVSGPTYGTRRFADFLETGTSTR